MIIFPLIMLQMMIPFKLENKLIKPTHDSL